MKSNHQLAKFTGHKASVHCVCVTPNSTSADDLHSDLSRLSFVSGGADRTVRTWDVKTGKKLKKFRHVRSISSMVVTNRGVRPLLATAGVERMIKLWDLNSGVLLRCLEGHLDQINTLTLWEGLQMLLISGSSDHTIRVFDMLSGECIAILVGHTDSVLSLAITNASDPMLISSSEDLSLGQWDLAKLLDDFYDLEGTRNETPALLPVIQYQPPDELDRENLSKDERKKIRKDRKKEKRKRNLSQGLRASYDCIDREEREENEEREEGREDREREEHPLSKAAREAQEAMEDSDEERPPEPVQPAKQPQQVQQQRASVSSNLLLQVMTKNKIVPDEPSSGHASKPSSRPGSSGSTGTLSKSNSLKNLSGRLINDWVRKALGINSSIVPLPSELAELESTGEPSPVEYTVTVMDSPVKSKRMFPADEPDREPANDPASELAKQPATQLASAQPVSIHSSQPIATTEPTEATPIATTPPEPDQPPAAAAAAAGPIVTDGTTITATVPDERFRQRTGSMIKEEDFRAKARVAQSNFQVAIIEKQLEEDRMKSKASEKLATRLMLKNKLISHTHCSSNEAGDLHALKAEKLKQHKLQENRRKQSMVVAQNRSAEALQKRLEELAKKKSALTTELETAEEEDDSDSDDDG